MLSSGRYVPIFEGKELKFITLLPVAAVSSVVDYKMTMLKGYGNLEEEKEAWSACHTRSARRVLKALLANGGQLHMPTNLDSTY